MKTIRRIQYLLLGALVMLSAACKEEEPLVVAPTAITGDASDIYRLGATLSGSIQNPHNASVKEVGIQFSELQSMAEYDELSAGAAGGSAFSVSVSSLSPGQTYYYRAYASSGASMVKGEVKSFTTTQSNAPVFGEVYTSNLTEQSVNVSTGILDEGGSELVLSGFCWKAGDGTPTAQDNVVNATLSGSTLQATIDGLTPGQIYSIRPYGVNGSGVGYGTTVTIVTLEATIPVLSKIEASDSTEVSITVKASVVGAGKGEVTKVGFCFSSESKTPTTEHLVVENVHGSPESEYFAAIIEGLTPETTYYIRAYAENEHGIGYSEVLVYTTPEAVIVKEPGIHSLEDLIAFRDARNAGADVSLWKNSEGVINIFADIDMSSVQNWEPIAYIDFNETLNGNGYTISGLNISLNNSSEYEYVGLVGYNNGKIGNVRLKSGTIVVGGETTIRSVGAVCGLNQAEIHDCLAEVSIETKDTWMNTGGIAGQNYGYIVDCENLGNITGIGWTAGISGQMNTLNEQYKGIVERCKNRGVISSSDDAAGIGIAGNPNQEIIDCINYGKIISPFWASGIGRALIISKCTNEGEVIGGNSHTGGITAALNNDQSLTDCVNKGSVVGEGNTGGIVGAIASDFVGTYSNNTNIGTVNGAAGTESNAIGKDLRSGDVNPNYEVTLSSAGILSSMISEDEKYSITSMKVSGPLNGDDIRFIREMAGIDVEGMPTAGILIDLDLSEATIVEGGGYYYFDGNAIHECFTSNDVIGRSMFDSSFLKRIVLPNNVTTIDYKAFYACQALEEIVISESVQTIGDYAFRSCQSLPNVILPNSVTSLGAYVFQYCSDLKDVILGNGLIDIPSGAFYRCYSLTEITIPSSVEVIGTDAFFQATNLTKVVISDSLTSIEMGAFSGCSSLYSINIPDGVTWIGQAAFSDCKSLVSINIPKGVTSIGTQTFQNCASLASITISDGVTSIGQMAFIDCSSLTSITIPDGVALIEDNVFQGCSSLAFVKIGDGVTSIGQMAFAYCSSLASIDIPNGVTLIGYGAFSGCSSLTSIDIPDGVTLIEGNVFFRCSSLASVKIGNGVTSIGDQAFYTEKQITDFTCNTTNPPSLGYISLYSINTLIVPTGCSAAYSESDWASYFTTIEEK